MKNNNGIAHSNADRIAVRNLTKMRKTENRTERKKTPDFHSAEQKHNRNLSRFAELKNDGIHSNSEKLNQRKTKISEQNYKRTKKH